MKKLLAFFLAILLVLSGTAEAGRGGRGFGGHAFGHPHSSAHAPKHASKPADALHQKRAETMRQNREAGRRREKEAEALIQKQHPNATIQREQYLRDKDGKIVKDPKSKDGKNSRRRLDFVVIEDGKVLKTYEVTSQTADKNKQMEKELRILGSGGYYIRDRDTGKLLEVPRDKPATERRLD